ncbi:MAG: NAD-dependent epimerase/dehydratase family protein, partial [Alphaproteobacteria bacterium]
MTVIALTGAAGRLGSYLREPLAKMATKLISTDMVDDLGKLYEGEEYRKADLADRAEMDAALKGADVVVHFGAFVDEGPFEKLWGPNFMGSYNVFESAYQQGAKRVVYASSIHAV